MSQPLKKQQIIGLFGDKSGTDLLNFLDPCCPIPASICSRISNQCSSGGGVQTVNSDPGPNVWVEQLHTGAPGQVSVDGTAWLTRDSFAVESINWDIRRLYGSSSTISIDWENRQLLSNIGNTAANWTDGLRSISGATGSRPTPAAGSFGVQYFDTDLGIPIWWNGTIWINASGTPV